MQMGGGEGEGGDGGSGSAVVGHTQGRPLKQATRQLKPALSPSTATWAQHMLQAWSAACTKGSVSPALARDALGYS